MNSGPVYQKSFAFALTIIQLYRQLQSEKEYILSKQLLRSGTSIGANVMEASAGQSKKDLWLKCQLPQKKQEKLYIG